MISIAKDRVKLVPVRTRGIRDFFIKDEVSRRFFYMPPNVVIKLNPIAETESKGLSGILIAFNVEEWSVDWVHFMPLRANGIVAKSFVVVSPFVFNVHPGRLWILRVCDPQRVSHSVNVEPMDFSAGEINHVYLVSTIEMSGLIDIFPACQREFLTELRV
jgi:hypothetical protein